jgi:carboxypeptidase family protein
LLALTPAAAYAQASIVGMVRDASGAVLPGVTVEAASPALIEKVRSVVTDGTGQYRIENLRPGPYTVTFILPGFATVKREGIELTGSFVATVNSDMRVGGVEETITVTGESPVVDVQSTTRQRVMDREVLDTIPTGRSQYNVGVLIPGVTLGGGQDVGGSGGQTAFPDLGIHGSKASDSVETMGGMSISVLSTGTHQPTRVNPAGTQEIVLDTASGDAEYTVGGVRIHRIPRDGGNTFNATFFTAFANGDMQGSNLTQDLRDRGLRTPDSIKTNWEANAGFGGPIRRDRLWYYFAARQMRSSMYAAGLFWNANLNNPNAWTYEPDLDRPAANEREQDDAQIRLTWQASPRNKIGLTWQEAVLCFCPQSARLTSALEAEPERSYPKRRITQIEWNNPLTNRLLFEVSGGVIWGISNNFPRPWLNAGIIGVVEQSTGMAYRAPSDFSRGRPERVESFRSAVSYVTGAHSVKVGMSHRSGSEREYRFDTTPLTYRFNNGSPNQLTQRAMPLELRTRVDHDMGVFAQDRWTLRGFTLTAGLRYDYYTNSFPEQHVGPAQLAPSRDITFPKQRGSTYQDITPRFGAAYDLFGTGKTAIKVSLNKYLVALGAGGFPGTESTNPVNNLVVSTTRSWNDLDRDFVADCNLITPTANGECGALANPNFGAIRTGTAYDPELLNGWRKRNFNWEFSTGLQHELGPRIAAEAGYFRRWYGNFPVTDNRSVSAADYDTFSLTAPPDPRLPGGGGYVISGLYDLKPARFGLPADNFITLSDNYGTQTEYWHGVDLTLNARIGDGMMLQGGLSTGRAVTDNCEVAAKVPETLFATANRVVALPLATQNAWTPQQYCHQTGAFLSQIKFLGSYRIPRVDVLVSGTFQSLPGPPIQATYNAPNALVRQALGRDLSAGANQNLSFNIVEPGLMYGERANQLDVRVAKILRLGRSRTNVGLDIYNVFNGNAPLTLNNAFGAWQRPTEILLARFVKLNLTFDF